MYALALITVIVGAITLVVNTLFAMLGADTWEERISYILNLPALLLLIIFTCIVLAYAHL